MIKDTISYNHGHISSMMMMMMILARLIFQKLTLIIILVTISIRAWIPLPKPITIFHKELLGSLAYSRYVTIIVIFPHTVVTARFITTQSWCVRAAHVNSPVIIVIQMTVKLVFLAFEYWQKPRLILINITENNIYTIS